MTPDDLQALSEQRAAQQEAEVLKAMKGLVLEDGDLLEAAEGTLRA